MSEAGKILTAVIIVLILMTGSFGVGYYFRQEKIVEKHLPPQIVRDTTKEIHYKDSIVVKYMPGTIEYIDTGSVIETKPFISKADTIIQHDTVHVEYAFPQNSFAFALRMKPDTTKIITINTIDTKIIDKTPAKWISILSHTGAGLAGGLIGFGIGRIR